MDSLNKTRSLYFYIKVHEAKKALIKDIGPINIVHFMVFVLCISRTHMHTAPTKAGTLDFDLEFHYRKLPYI